MLPEAKAWLIDIAGLSKDALHVHVGLAIFLAAMLLFRRRPGDVLPLAIACGVALLGEAWDVRDRWMAGMTADPAGHLHDIVNTLFWPALITLAGRTGVGIRRRRR